MKRTSPRCSALALILALPFAPGCLATADDSTAASEAADSLEATSSEGAILGVGSDGALATMTTAALATNAVANAGKLLTPASCVTATAAGATATYVLADCAGPYGLLDVTGTVTLTFSTDGTSVTVTGAATDLAVNGAKIDFISTGTLTTTTSTGGTTRSLAVTTSGSGTGTRGNAIARSGSYTVTWDGTCLTLDGTWSTVAVGRTWTTTVSGFKHCSGMCPAANGSIVYTGGILGTSVTITFSGQDTATWSTSTGGKGIVTLSCGTTST